MDLKGRGGDANKSCGQLNEDRRQNEGPFEVHTI